MNIRRIFSEECWPYAVLVLVLLSSGCKSVESTMVTRDEMNHEWERHNCLNGIPITIKVPTHLKLYVFHKHYLSLVTDSVDTNVKTVEPVDLDVVVRDFAHELMYTEKVFFVDFKRPLSGSQNLKVDMTEEQYIDQIQQEITDSTLLDVSNLLGAFGGVSEISTSSGSAVLAGVNSVDSLAAVGIFEVDAPDFEQKVKQFIDCHINKSHDAWVVPKGVEHFNRVGIPQSDNTQQPYPDVPLCPDENCIPAVVSAELLN